jgi:hypothetical protein
LPRKKDHSPCFLSLWFPVSRKLQSGHCS